MCQLLGMNANVPTDICFSFTGFRARGGLTDHHRDGWGIAFFEGKGARVFLEPDAALVLEDKVLDAQLDEGGAVTFAIGQQES